jgi:hypothetical protein
MSTENVRQLGTDELCDWLKTCLDEDEWKDVDMVIRKQKIKGKTFLDITVQNWMSVGLTLGVATSLFQISEAINLPKKDDVKNHWKLIEIEIL